MYFLPSFSTVINSSFGTGCAAVRWASRINLYARRDFSVSTELGMSNFMSNEKCIQKFIACAFVTNGSGRVKKGSTTIEHRVSWRIPSNLNIPPPGFFQDKRI